MAETTDPGLTQLPPLGVYVHLPWCLRKCPYCDFNSHQVPEEGFDEAAYLDALEADLEASLPGLRACRALLVAIPASLEEQPRIVDLLHDQETLGRLRLDMLVVIYDDAAYGAEVHHFRPMGIPVELAQFPPTDFAALAEAAGCRGLTARTAADLDGVREWLENRDRPLVLDAKVDPDICAEWLEEAFRGH